jgi:hypothetical protein
LKFIATEPKLSSPRGNNVNGVSVDAKVVFGAKMGVPFFQIGLILEMNGNFAYGWAIKKLRKFVNIKFRIGF